MNLAELFSLLSKLDPQTTRLFFSYIELAKRAPDMNAFFKRTLQAAIDAETQVTVTVEQPRKRI